MTIRSKVNRRQISLRQSALLTDKLQAFIVEYPAFLDRQLPKIAVIYEEGIGGGFDIGIINEPKQLTVVMPFQLARHLHITRLNQLFAVIVWLLKAGSEAEAITFNLSDGEAASVARFAASSPTTGIIPIPDEYFFSSRGFVAARGTADKCTISWDDRLDELVWRGGAAGTGTFNPALELADNLGVRQRIRLAHLLNGSEVDFKFVKSYTVDGDWNTLQRAGLSGDPIPEQSWACRKYAIDIDGFTNTWSNLIIRMHYGCCVLKIVSQYGYRQWYYHDLKPFEHFVPVAADLSNFWERWDWVKSHPAEAKAIAKQGQDFVRRMTFESEANVAAELIRENWKDG